MPFTSSQVSADAMFFGNQSVQIKVSLAWLSNGNVVIAYDHPDLDIEVRDGIHFRPIRRFSANGESVRSMIVTTNDLIVVGGSNQDTRINPPTRSRNDTIRVYDPSNGELLRKYSQLGYDAECMLLLPSNEIAVGSDVWGHGLLRIYNININPDDPSCVRIFKQTGDRINLMLNGSDNEIICMSRSMRNARVFNYAEKRVSFSMTMDEQTVRKTIVELRDKECQGFLPIKSETSKFEINIVKTADSKLVADVQPKKEFKDQEDECVTLTKTMFGSYSTFNRDQINKNHLGSTNEIKSEKEESQNGPGTTLDSQTQKFSFN